MSIQKLTNFISGRALQDIYVKNITATGTITLPNVISDSTDLILSTDKIMISNGTHEIKMSAIEISGNSIISADTLSISAPSNKDVLIDSLGTGVIRLNSLTNKPVEIAGILTIDNITSSAGSDLTINAPTGKNIILEGLGGGYVNVNDALYVGGGILSDTSRNATLATVNTNTCNAGYGFTEIFLNTGETFSEVANPLAPCYMGLKFTTATTHTITALKVWRTANMGTSRTLRIWNGAGVQLATATTSNEQIGWNISGALSTGPLTITPGTYTISHDVAVLYASYSDNIISYPTTYNGITLTSFVSNGGGAGYPNTLLSASYFTGIDMLFDGAVSALPLNFGGVQTVSNYSMSGSLSGVPRILWGYFDPSSGTAVTMLRGSYGFLNAVYIAQGQFEVRFTDKFQYAPSVVATIDQPSNAIADNVHIYVGAVSTTGCFIYCINPGVAWFNSQFYIQIIGI